MPHRDAAPRPPLPGAPPLVRADGSVARVLVVDDEPALAETVADALAADAWDVRVAGRGSDALALARDFQPNLVVLDIMMPGIDGFAVLDRLRAVRPDTRVLFLTALDGQGDRLHGLRAGGDYLTKPFEVAELQARARAIVRTGAGLAGTAAVTRVGGLELDHADRIARVDGERVELTSTEFELLLLFANNAGRVLQRARILEAVWGYDYGPDSNLVEVYVSSLRRRLGPAASVRLDTVRLVGYVLRTVEAPDTPGSDTEVADR